MAAAGEVNGDLDAYFAPAPALRRRRGRPKGGETLQLIREPSGLRHVLSGMPLHPGAVVELAVGRQWVRGKYQWRFELGTPPELVIEEMWGPHRIALLDEDMLRWPAR